MIVVADTSPLNYLILIGHSDVLPRLFGDVLIPQMVLDELGGSGAPPEILDWLEAAPEWLEVVPFASTPSASLDHLDAGERDAIQLAVELSADLVLLDDRKARFVAKRLGLSITGTIGILDKAARSGLINISDAVDSLSRTDFYVSEDILQALLNSHRS